MYKVVNTDSVSVMQQISVQYIFLFQLGSDSVSV